MPAKTNMKPSQIVNELQKCRTPDPILRTHIDMLFDLPQAELERMLRQITALARDIHLLGPTASLEVIAAIARMDGVPTPKQ